MRQVRYSVAMSLDGYIADPDGGSDWITTDPDIDFEAMFAGYDTVLMGRHTFEVTLRHGAGPAMPGMLPIVFSRTLRPADFPQVRVVASGADAVVADLKARPGKDIWLMGGGILFRSLLDARLVDAVEIGLIPVLLGDGIPMLPPGGPGAGLRLTGSRSLSTGIQMLQYDILYPTR